MYHQFSPSLLVATFVVVALTTVSSLTPVAALGAGKCPDVAVRSDFNLTAFYGDWYEISTTPLARKTFEHGCFCTVANYAAQTDGTVAVVNSCHKGAVNGTLQVANGVAKVGAAPAKLKVRFSKFSPYANYWVIAGDAAERDYVVVWSCTSLLVANFQILWVLARRPVLDAATYARAVAEGERALHGTGLTSQLTMTTQQGCTATTTTMGVVADVHAHHDAINDDDYHVTDRRRRRRSVKSSKQ
jgi:apolipoprotein D and lipocalin family protein